jgi:hypothetical protein
VATSGFGTDAENALLNVALRGVVYPLTAGQYISLHSADPGTTGAFEVAGASYSRKLGVWNVPVAGVCSLANDIDFLGLPTTSIDFYGVWTAGGTFVGGGVCDHADLIIGDAYRLFAGTTFTIARLTS